MSKRQYREAAKAKRTIPTADLTDAQCDVIDAAWDRSKYDPELQRKRLHDQIQDQQRMLRILGQSL